ncbi:MAG: hypothetical protein ABI037_01910 [Gemmatimonadales bacterium]
MKTYQPPALEVNITADLASVNVMHQGQNITIMRNQNQTNVVNPAFAKTSRKCPPFCIQPSELAPGVTTIGELEVLHFLKTIGDGDTSMMVIDSRTPGREDTRIIPGTVTIPWDKLRHRQLGSEHRARHPGKPTGRQATGRLLELR